MNAPISIYNDHLKLNEVGQQLDLRLQRALDPILTDATDQNLNLREIEGLIVAIAGCLISEKILLRGVERARKERENAG